MRYLLIILLFSLPSLVFGQRWFDLSGISIPSNVPTIQVTGGFTPFSASFGIFSQYQTVTVSGFSLTNNVVVTFTAAQGMEVSSDNVTYGASATIVRSGSVLPNNNNVTIFVRIAASTAVGSYSGNIIFTSGGATTINVPFTASVASSATEAKFMLGGDASMLSQAGWTRCFNPGAGASSYTDLSTGFILNRIAGAWAGNFGSVYGYNDQGPQSGTFGSEFPQNVYSGFWINIGVPSAAFVNQGYGITISNLSAGTYVVEITGSCTPAFNSGITTGEYRVRFGPTGADNEQHTMNNQNNTSNFLIFPLSGVGTITAGQLIYISMNANQFGSPGGVVGNGIRVRKVS